MKYLKINGRGISFNLGIPSTLRSTKHCVWASASAAKRFSPPSLHHQRQAILERQASMGRGEAEKKRKNLRDGESVHTGRPWPCRAWVTCAHVDLLHVTANLAGCGRLEMEVCSSMEKLANASMASISLGRTWSAAR